MFPRSSSSSKRLLIVLGIAALAGCGGAGNERRSAVNSYFDRVQQAQAPLRNERGPIELAFQQFSIDQNSQTEVKALKHAQSVLARVRDEVRAIHPPAEARTIHADLVHMLDLEAGVADELVWMTRYHPQVTEALGPLRPAATALNRDIHTAKGWKALAGAFGRYRTSLEAILGRLEALSAPPTLRPALAAERRVLRRSAALCASIEAALARHDTRAASAAVKALDQTNAGDTAAKARVDQIAAVKAYQARLARIRILGAKVNRDRLKLVDQVG